MTNLRWDLQILQHIWGQMNFHRQIDKFDSDKKLPLGIYASVVSSLYADQAALIVGALSTFVAASILYARSADVMHLLFAIVLVCFSIKRIIEARAFEKKRDEIKGSYEQLAFWENRYLISGSIYGALLGLWCFGTSARSTDDFALLMTISITLANFIGITGRNFGSEKVVSAQLVSTAVPLVLGSILFGDIYHIMLGAFLLPFIFGIKLMARRLRNILLDATAKADENKLIANRFDATLNNITHGVAMINAAGTLVVINDQFADLVGVEHDTLIDQEFSHIEGGATTLHNLENDKHNLFDDIGDCLKSGQSRRYSYVLNNERIVEFNYYPMKEGGVILLEDISLRVASEAEIKALAKFDPLTNLPNRRFFMEEVDRKLMKNGKLAPCALFFVDLDKFKDINDSLGHTTGDKLLNTIAVRLKGMMGAKSVICRFGGDEFVIVVPGISNKKRCSEFAEKLVAEIGKPLLLEGHQVIMGATIGISMSPENGNNADQLLKYSDAALYQAKSVGRGSYAFYSDELGQSISNRRQIESDLREAIDRGQFQINYQPLVDLKENRINTCEALLRWNHPEHDWIPPDEFIPIAEEIGFITRLGEYVLEKAALQCLQWPSHMRVAVNVSSIQFEKSDVYKVVRDVLKKTGLAPHRLEVEITESSMLGNIESTKKVLLKLSKLGVKISLDDFGTGFSSLSYLHTLPLDKVKIDRSFIKNLHTNKKPILLLEGISKLSHSLGLRVVVEGVETIDQLKMLQERIHVDEVQGFLFGKALPPENLTNLLEGKESLYAAKRSREKIAVG